MSKVDGLSRYESIPPLANNFPIKIRRYGASSGPVPHWHEHIELLYFLSGGCSVTVSGRAHPASAGDLVIVNPTEIHSFDVVEAGTEYLCIIIYPEFFSDVSYSGVMLSNLVCADPEVGELILAMYAEEEKEGVGADMMKKSVAYRLMAHLVREYLTDRMTERHREQHTARLSRLSAVFDYVSENYTSHISTQDLASVCYLSEAHFCRFFKSATGKTPVEYVNEYRIERAAVLLENTDIPLSLLAERVGIDDANYFSRMFKKIKKLPPNKYRARLREGEL